MVTVLLILAAVVILTGLIGISRLALTQTFGFVYFGATLNCMWDLLVKVLEAIHDANK